MEAQVATATTEKIRTRRNKRKILSGKPRRFAIGDTHGCYLALMDVLEQVKYDPYEDELYFLSDFVDGWKDHIRLINWIIEQKSYGAKIYCVLGNHDEWIRDLFFNLHEEDRYGERFGWFQNGGAQTHNVYMEYKSESTHRDYHDMFNAHKKFFNELPLYHVTEDNILFVHAGYDPLLGIKKTALNQPNMLLWDRDFWYRQIGSDRVYPEHKHIYIGHTSVAGHPEWWDEVARDEVARRKADRKIILSAEDWKFWVNQYINGLRPVTFGNVTNLDTGAGWAGKLTIYNIDTHEYFMSDFVKTYYPNETGRN